MARGKTSKLKNMVLEGGMYATGFLIYHCYTKPLHNIQQTCKHWYFHWKKIPHKLDATAPFQRYERK